MPVTPHKEKLNAALVNPKCKDDKDVLLKAAHYYEDWIASMTKLESTGKQRVIEMTELLNTYKDRLEVELICKQGTEFLRRQKGQLKLDNSVIEEFLAHLVSPNILKGLPTFDLETGPRTAFMSLSFRPSSVNSLDGKPEIVLKQKDQDFTIGKRIYYKFSASSEFESPKTTEGNLFLAVLAAECKVNLDKTMFQECAGTATRLKLGCPISQYYVLVEYLDMEPEDCRLTDIDNVFLLRKAKRLPFDKRSSYDHVRRQHEERPIDSEVVWKFVEIMQGFVDAVWYDSTAALTRGTFV